MVFFESFSYFSNNFRNFQMFSKYFWIFLITPEFFWKFYSKIPLKFKMTLATLKNYPKCLLPEKCFVDEPEIILTKVPVKGQGYYGLTFTPSWKFFELMYAIIWFDVYIFFVDCKKGRHPKLNSPLGTY